VNLIARIRDQDNERNSFLSAGTGKAMIKYLPDFSGKEDMVEMVWFAPGQPHQHNAELFVKVKSALPWAPVKHSEPPSGMREFFPKYRVPAPFPAGYKSPCPCNGVSSAPSPFCLY
jgi:hypothetical protein